MKTRLWVSVVVGLLTAGVVTTAEQAVGVLAGIAVAGTLFVASGWIALAPMDAHDTQSHVGKEDFSSHVDEAVVVVAALLGLGSIVVLLVAGGPDAGALPAAAAVLGVFMAWASLHLMYAVRYAHKYYCGSAPHPIQFGDEEPAFIDFLYFSYNLGMTYQVSDTEVTSREIRRIVLRHCLLAYVFGTAVLATTINLVVGALSG